MEYVAFPGLGLDKIPISRGFELFDTGITIYWYGVVIALGFALAVVYALRTYKRFDLDMDRMIDVVLVAAVIAIVCARLYYILFSEDRAAYFADPLSMLDIRDGGMAIYGAVIGAFVTGLWMCRLRKVNTLAMFDIASIGFCIGQGLGRWGNFFNQEAFGINTTLPWGMTGSRIIRGEVGKGYDPSLPVHPTFLYESLWCLIGFIGLHILSKKAYKFKGQLFATYLMWYGLGRSIFEGLRTDSLTFGPFRVSQLLSVLLIIGGAVLYYVLSRRAKLATVGAVETVADESDVSLSELKAEELTTLTLSDVDEETEQTEEQNDGEDH